MRRWAAGLVGGGLLVGCASPGPPRAPSLQLPQPVKDLSAARVGDRVELRFTLPQRTTDGLAIREAGVKASVCRGAEGEPCVVVPALEKVAVAVDPGASAAERAVSWHDELPAGDRAGEARLLIYRVELSNLEGKTAGWSDPAYAAAGAAPAAVGGLSAEETRAGILLRWDAAGSAGNSAGDEVLLRREVVTTPLGPKGPPGTPVGIPPGPKGAARTPAPARAGAKGAAAEAVWLETHADGAGETMDGSASEDTAYRYVAVRRRVVTVGGQKVELRSALSAPVEITWRNAFPPAAPAGLSAAPFADGAIDLVWEPVGEPGLKGYVVTRQVLDAGPVERLTPEPVALPAFHDASARAGVRYRYGVRAVSKKGVEGEEATVVVGP